jgi:diguanylate cyclase (GGDEF)-like protein
MLTKFHIFLIAGLFCLVMLLALVSLRRSSLPGIKEWLLANALGCITFLLYGLGDELPHLLVHEGAAGVYAAAGAAALVGFRRFFDQKVPWRTLGDSIALVVMLVAVYHDIVESFPIRTAVVSVFHAAVCVSIALTVLRSRVARRTLYPYIFTGGIAAAVGFGHLAYALVATYGELTLSSPPFAWTFAFWSASTVTLPALTLGALLMVYDRLMEKTEHAANRDFLTGAWSRRAFFEIAAREQARTARTGRQFCLLMLDVDRFKAINDKFGHAVGDQVLVDLVVCAGTVTRDVDYFARIGGEEFALLLPDTELSTARAVAERLRRTLERKITIRDVDGTPSTVAYTVSIGLAERRNAESFRELLQRADAALYEAKESGRNVLVTSDH